MKEANGNMLYMDCDALVITTNGYVTSSGDAVMGRGIAKQVSDDIPWIKKALGTHIRSNGNIVGCMGYHNNVALVTYPVKPAFVVNTGFNVVEHAKFKFKFSETVPGFLAKASIILITNSAHQLVKLADEHNWVDVICPRFGCGAGELSWDEVRSYVKPILDDRFTVVTY